MYRLLIPLLLLMPELAHAATVMSIAERFLNDVTRLGIVVCCIGFVLGGVSLAGGNPDGGRKITGALIGLLVTAGVMAIKQFILGMV